MLKIATITPSSYIDQQYYRYVAIISIIFFAPKFLSGIPMRRPIKKSTTSSLVIILSMMNFKAIYTDVNPFDSIAYLF